VKITEKYMSILYQKLLKHMRNTAKGAEVFAGDKYERWSISAMHVQHE